VIFAPESRIEAPQALDQLRGFSELLAASGELRSVLLSPAVPVARKRAVVGKLGEQIGIHRVIRNFLYVVMDHRRVGVFGEIVAAFETVIDERMGRVRALVTAAAPLSEPEQQALGAELERTTRKQVRCEFEVEPGLLGGVSVRIGSTIYDGSVRGQLAALRQRLAME